ncbi:MAG: type II toxin-antitoxin system Phd/YefM family antitoxin [Clostridia bacterium]|nr:type II toxin-antitoxin system Phd/YefM family antitoxin [Clostridia bacterium]
MAINADTLKRMVPITLFNRGQATKIFDRVKAEGQLVVLRNNTPEAIILSPDEFTRMTETVEDYRLLLLAQQRLANNNEANAISEAEVMRDLGITEADLEGAGDVEIE